MGKFISSRFYWCLSLYTSVSSCQAVNNNTGLICTSKGGVGPFVSTLRTCIQALLTLFEVWAPVFSQPFIINQKSCWILDAEHRESGINLFKQRWAEKCHSHGKVCQQALKVWWVRASSGVCCHRITHWVCPVWFLELLFLNGLVCQHLQIPLRGQNKELSCHYSVGIFLSAWNDCVWWE